MRGLKGNNALNLAIHIAAYCLSCNKDYRRVARQIKTNFPWHFRNEPSLTNHNVCFAEATTRRLKG